ncbi:MAG: outer membrane beta-barrel protein [Candidatus Eisenbacteria bacterium]
MRVLSFMIVCSAIAGSACNVQGGGIPEHSVVLSTETGTTTADARSALATLDLSVSETDTVRVDTSASLSRDALASPLTPSAPPSPGLEPLVPSLAGRTFALEPGPRPFLHRLAFSPGVGQMGDEPLYTLRMAYNPNPWLGWEAYVAHNKGKSVHALFNMLNAQIRYPVPFRLQPYLTGGFGVVLVYPGPSVNADPVTENALAGGVGLEFYLRDDVALRGEWRRTSVFARDRYTEESAVYAYDELTVGFSFYRRIGDEL